MTFWMGLIGAIGLIVIGTILVFDSKQPKVQITRLKDSDGVVFYALEQPRFIGRSLWFCYSWNEGDARRYATIDDAANELRGLNRRGDCWQPINFGAYGYQRI